MNAKPKYWNQEGKYQEQYTIFFNELVPNSGEAETVEGELLRAITKLQYDAHNNGYGSGYMDEGISPEEFYNETYGK
jgi:hypothetical protein